MNTAVFVKRPLNDGTSRVYIGTVGSELQRRALLGFSTSINIMEQPAYKTEEQKMCGNSSPALNRSERQQADFLGSLRMGTLQEASSLHLLMSEFCLETKSHLTPYTTQL